MRALYTICLAARICLINLKYVDSKPDSKNWRLVTLAFYRWILNYWSWQGRKESRKGAHFPPCHLHSKNNNLCSFDVGVKADTPHMQEMGDIWSCMFFYECWCIQILKWDWHLFLKSWNRGAEHWVFSSNWSSDVSRRCAYLWPLKLCSKHLNGKASSSAGGKLRNLLRGTQVNV